MHSIFLVCEIFHNLTCIYLSIYVNISICSQLKGRKTIGFFDFFNQEPQKTLESAPTPHIIDKIDETMYTLVATRKLLVEAAGLEGGVTEVSSTKSYDMETSMVDGFNHDPFMSRKGFNTIDEMLTDESVYAILELKKRFILSTGYKFVGEEDEFVEFLEKSLNSYYKGLFGEDLYQMLSAFEYGFSLSEKVFTKDEGKIWLKRIKAVPPHSIDFYTDDFGKLIKIEQRQLRGTKSLPLNKMLIYTNNKQFDNPYGVTDLKRCYRAWFAKNMSIKFWNIYLQRFASPFPVAKVDDQFGDDKTKQMVRLMDSIQQTVSLVIPKSAELDLFKVGNSSGEYDKAVERYNQMISRALLLPDLMGFGQTTQGGSYSLGEQQFAMFYSICNSVRQALEELINEQVIKPLIDMNFGSQENYPRFMFQPYEDPAVKKTMETFLMAVEKGMPVTIEDWNYLRDQLKFPSISEEDMPEEVEVELPPNPDMPPEEAMPEEEDDEEADVKAVQTEYWRGVHPYEARVPFQKESDNLDRMVQSTITRVSDKYKDVREALKDMINRKRILQDNIYSQVDKLQLKYIGDVRIMYQRDLQEIYRQGKLDARKDLAIIRNKAFVEDLENPQLTLEEYDDATEELIAGLAYQMAGEQKDKLLDKSKMAVLLALQNGWTQNKLNQELNNIFDEVTSDVMDKGLNRTPAQVKTAARTAATKIYNQGRRAIGNTTDGVWGYRYSAILDSRTTERCRYLDGKYFAKEDPILNTITPPNHYNCRSRLEFIMDMDVEDNPDITKPTEVNVDKLNKLPGGDGFM